MSRRKELESRPDFWKRVLGEKRYETLKADRTEKNGKDQDKETETVWICYERALSKVPYDGLDEREAGFPFFYYVFLETGFL